MDASVLEGAGFFFMGGAELAIAFRFAGVPGKVVHTRDDGLEAFRQARSGSCRVLIASRDAADLVRPELVAWQLGGAYPLVVEIPALDGETELGKSLVDLIRDAIGLHV